MSTNFNPTEKIPDNSIQMTPEKGTSNSKKNLSFIEVYQLIKKMNLEYNKNQTMEIIEELGIDQKKTIELDNLIETSKRRRHSSKYANFYDNILNMFTTPSERIVKILEECSDKLREINQEGLVKDLEWVTKKIHDGDIYNLNLDFINEINSFQFRNSIDNNTDMESAMKFLAEYSSDTFTKNKKEDVKVVKSLSCKRMQYTKSNRDSLASHHNSISANRNYSVFNNEPTQIINSFALSPDNSRSLNAGKSSVIGFNRTMTPSNFLSPKISALMSLSATASAENTNFEVIKEEDDKKRSNTETNEDEESEDKKSSVKSKSDSESEMEELEMSINSKQNSLPLIGRMSISLLKRNSVNSNTLNTVLQNNNSIDDIDFNVFEYADTFGRENVLINISDHIFEKFSLYCIINSKRFETFLDKIRVGYDYLLPYHNDLHASDVLQTSNVFTIYANLKSEMDLTSLDLAAFFIACIIHDFKHPGLNNTYQINKKTAIATKYNDISVLENYHLSSAFKIISHPNSNIFCDLSIEEYRVARKRIVECVLSTDMAKHTKSQTNIKIKIDQFKNKSLPEKILYNFIHNANEDTKFDRQQEILNYLIHAADISNPGKKFHVAKLWTDQVMEEFFLQGDKERSESLPISFLCDRTTTNVPKSQVMFISNIILPCFKIMSIFAPQCGVFIQNMYENIEEWKKRDESKNSLSDGKLEIEKDK